MVASYDSFGASRFPLIPTEDCAENYDPGLGTIVALLSAAIEANCGDAWRVIVQRLDGDHFLADSTGPVSSIHTVVPSIQNLTQTKRAWPVLAVYREGEPVNAQKTIDYYTSTQKWSVDWIVGPLSPASQRKIGHFWIQIRNTIFAAITLGHHDAYQNGAYQFHGQFSEIHTTGAGGPAVSQELTTDKGQGYFGGSVTLETVERLTFQGDTSGIGFEGGAYTTPNDGYGTPATGADVIANFGNKT